MTTTKKSSGLGGGLWIIPFGLLLAGLWSLYRAITQWKSGSCAWVKDSNGIDRWLCDESIRVGFFTVGATWFAIIFLACAICSYLWMRSER